MKKGQRDISTGGTFQFGKSLGDTTLPYIENEKRNVIDKFKWLSTEYIKAHTDTLRLSYSILLVNIEYDNNTGNIIRSSNAFGAKEVILYGRKKFDRRSAVGSEFYSNFKHVRFVEELEVVFKDYDCVVGLDNVSTAQPLEEFVWDINKNYLLCFGHEGSGLPIEILDRCDVTLEIFQMGTIRSLNVSVAAGIVMHDYCIKTAKKSKK